MEKVKLIAGVTSRSDSKVKAGDLVNFVAQQVGGKGGGRADWRRQAEPSPIICPLPWKVSLLGRARLSIFKPILESRLQ